MTIREAFSDLVVILLILVKNIVQYASGVGVAMGVLWLIGILYPYVAQALGLPFSNVYVLLDSLFNDLTALVKAG